MLHYGAMAIFKVGIILLNLVPYIALHFSLKSRRSDK